MTDLNQLRNAYAAAKQASDDINAKYGDWQRGQNEGHCGYNPHERAMNAAATEAGKAKRALDDALFWRDWTPEVFADRRAAWNAAMMALPGASKGKVKGTDLAAMEDRLGYTAEQMLKAKARYVGAAR